MKKIKTIVAALSAAMVCAGSASCGRTAAKDMASLTLLSDSWESVGNWDPVSRLGGDICSDSLPAV